MAKIEEMTDADAAREAKTPNAKATEGTKTATTTTTTTTTAATGGKRDSTTAPKPTPPTISPKMFISPILLMGGKRMGIDYKDPAHVAKIRMCFVVAMTMLALCFAHLWVTMKKRKKKLEEDTCEVKVKDVQSGETKTEKVTLYEPVSYTHLTLPTILLV